MRSDIARLGACALGLVACSPAPEAAAPSVVIVGAAPQVAPAPPEPVQQRPHARRVSLIMRACALSPDGRLFEQVDAALQPVDPAGRFHGVSCGQMHGCAWTPSGEVWCWGHNSDGRVGIGTKSEEEPLSRVPKLYGVTDMAAGARSSCAVHDGRVSCWGDDAALAPKQVPGLSDIVRITSSTIEARCALDRKGRVHRFDWRYEPFVLEQLPPLREIAECLESTCGVTDQEGVVCWGSGSGLQQVAVAEPSRVASTGRHACVLSRGGSVSCWTLGAEGAGEPQALSLPLPGGPTRIEDAQDLAGAYGAYCVLREQSIACFELDDSLAVQALSVFALPSEAPAPSK